MGKQKLIGRVAIITGAASGIGRSTVELFLNEGAKVIGFDMNPETSNALTKRVAEQGFDSNFHMRLGDVADEADIASTVEFARDSFGRVDIMFNNAGLGGAFGPIVKTDVEHWDATFAINMRGVFLGTKYAAMAMVDQGDGGAIINTASVAGTTGSSGPAAYSAAKAGVINFTQNSAVELGVSGIRVNVICPGLIFTPIIGDEAKALEKTQRLQALPKKGASEDIANAALFLASDDSAFITGQSIIVDGGYTINGGLFDIPTGSTGMAYGTTGKALEIKGIDQ